MHDFQFAADKRATVCALDDYVNNPNPELGCNFYQAGLAFSAFSWYYISRTSSDVIRFLWTISMTWIISRIHKRVRKNQMDKDMSWKGKDKEFVDGRDLESQGSTFA